MNIKDFKQRKTVIREVDIEYYNQVEEVDNYLREKIAYYLENSTWLCKNKDGIYIAYVHNDIEDWKAILSMIEKHSPKTKEEFIEMLHEEASFAMSEAEADLENTILLLIKGECLTKDEVDYLEEVHDWDFYNSIFRAEYAYDHMWESTRESKWLW